MGLAIAKTGSQKAFVHQNGGPAAAGRGLSQLQQLPEPIEKVSRGE
jgi:hypothetical protein